MALKRRIEKPEFLVRCSVRGKVISRHVPGIQKRFHCFLLSARRAVNRRPADRVGSVARRIWSLNRCRVSVRAVIVLVVRRQQPFQFGDQPSREGQKDTSRPLATTGHFLSGDHLLTRQAKRGGGKP